MEAIFILQATQVSLTDELLIFSNILAIIYNGLNSDFSEMASLHRFRWLKRTPYIYVYTLFLCIYIYIYLIFLYTFPTSLTSVINAFVLAASLLCLYLHRPQQPIKINLKSLRIARIPSGPFLFPKEHFPKMRIVKSAAVSLLWVLDFAIFI